MKQKNVFLFFLLLRNYFKSSLTFSFRFPFPTETHWTWKCGCFYIYSHNFFWLPLLAVGVLKDGDNQELEWKSCLRISMMQNLLHILDRYPSLRLCKIIFRFQVHATTCIAKEKTRINIRLRTECNFTTFKGQSYAITVEILRNQSIKHRFCKHNVQSVSAQWLCKITRV